MKRFLKHIFLLVAAIAISNNLHAYDFEVDGFYYNVVSLSNLTCAVTSGSTKYRGIVNIPENVIYNNRQLTVVAIATSAFMDCSNLTYVEMPNTITSIGVSAFKNCSRIYSIKLSNALTNIGESAFSGCTGLTSIDLPNSLTKINAYTFSGCTGLRSISFSNSLTSIGESAFSGCTGLTSIDLPNSLAKINAYTFSGCTGLRSINFSNSLTSIGRRAFEGCKNLTSLRLPNSLTQTGEWAFGDCSGLTYIELPNSIIEISYRSFTGCTGLTSIQIPNSVETIRESAFEGCKGLISVEIPDSVKTIEGHAFIHCDNLIRVYMGMNSVSYLGEETFRYCPKLNELYVSANINKFNFAKYKEPETTGYYYIGPFNECENIKNLYYNDSDCSLSFSNETVSMNIPHSDLEELYLGRNIIDVRDNCRYEYTNSLKKITFGAELNAISGYYQNLNKIPITTEIYCKNPTPPSFGTSFSNSQYIHNNVYVPIESLEDYQQAAGWKNFWNLKGYDFNSGVEIIENGQSTTYRVYNIQGIFITEANDMNEVRNLPHGLYIVNGKKIMVP